MLVNRKDNSHFSSFKPESRYISAVDELKIFLQRDHILDKLLAALQLFAALGKNTSAAQNISAIVAESSYLNLINSDAQFEFSKNGENVKDLVLLLSASEVKECKKLVHETLLKEVFPNSNEQHGTLSFQESLNRWYALIDKICHEDYDRTNFSNEKSINANLSIAKRNFNFVVGMTTSYLKYLNIIENKYKNLSENLKNTLTAFISELSPWQKLQGIAPIFIPLLISYLSIKEIKALRLVNFWLYYEMTQHIKNIKIYMRDEIEGKIKAFAPIGGVNTITLAKAENKMASYIGEDMKKIASLLREVDSIDRLKSINFNNCNLNGIDFLGNLNSFTKLENIEIKQVNLLPVCNEKQIPENALFSINSGFNNLTSLEIKNSYISRFLMISLENLPKLRKLILINNNFWRDKSNLNAIYDDEDFSFLKNLKQLQHLELHSTEIGISNNTLSYLQELDLLEYLSLYFCSGINDDGLRQLFENKLRKIKELMLDYCPNVTDEGIKHLSQDGLSEIKNLYLVLFDNLTGESLKYIEKIKSLKSLYLQDCPGITAESVQNLINKSKNIQISLA